MVRLKPELRAQGTKKFLVTIMRLGKREIDYLLQVYILTTPGIRLALRNERLFELARELTQGKVLVMSTRQQNYRISAALEGKGLLTRATSDGDQRKVSVMVTKEGRDLITGNYHAELFTLLKKLLPRDSSPSRVTNLLYAVFVDEFIEFGGDAMDREGTQDPGRGHQGNDGEKDGMAELSELQAEMRRITALNDTLQETVNAFVDISGIAPEDALEYSGLQKKIVFDNVSLLEGWKRRFVVVKELKSALKVSQEARVEQARMLAELKARVKELEEAAE